jgi:hypothetical protein
MYHIWESAYTFQYVNVKGSDQTRRLLVDKFEMDRREIAREIMDWIHLAAM